MSKDPIGFGIDGPNLYRYAGNDPVNYVDENGQNAAVAAAAGAAAAAAAGAYVGGKFLYCASRRANCEYVLNRDLKKKYPPSFPEDYPECPPPVTQDDEDWRADEEANDQACGSCFADCMTSTGFFGWPVWPGRCP